MIFSPHLDQYLCLPQVIEDFAVQQLIPHLAIERFDIAILPGTAFLDEQRADVQARQPVADPRVEILDDREVGGRPRPAVAVRPLAGCTLEPGDPGRGGAGSG